MQSKFKKERKEIDNLKNIIAYGEHRNDEVDNLKRNLEYTEGYLNHIRIIWMKPCKTLLKNKHREEQLDSLT